MQISGLETSTVHIEILPQRTKVQHPLSKNPESQKILTRRYERLSVLDMVLAYMFNPSIGTGSRDSQICEFQATLVYTVT